MRPKHPSTKNGDSDSSVGKVLLVPPEVNEIAVTFSPANGGFRWYQDDSGDEVADEVLAWAATEETKNPPSAPPPKPAPLAGRQPE